MTGHTIQLSTAAHQTLAAYLALPERPRAAAVVVLQEIFGVNANIRAVADGYAQAGYIAIAPDLFWRQKPGIELNPAKAEDRELATQLRDGLNPEEAVQDALVAAAYVRSLPASTGNVAAVGYCLGGKLAYLLAMRPGIDAAISYYGVGIHHALEQAPTIKCRVLLHIAGADPLCPPEAQAAIKTAFDPLKERVKILDYPGAGHAFARQGGATYDPASAERANSATLAFLAAESSPT